MDANIGLQFSLDLLKKYQKNGLLQALVARMPGLSGKCYVEVTVMQGDVISCRASNQEGKISNVDLNLLLKLDKIRGPFEWRLVPLALAETGVSPTTRPLSPSLFERDGGGGIRSIVGSTTRPLSPSLLEPFEQNSILISKSPSSPIPHVIARLNLGQASSWTLVQKHALITIYSLVDGNRTIDDIKLAVAFPAQLVDEVFQTLVWIGAIRISAHYAL